MWNRDPFISAMVGAVLIGIALAIHAYFFVPSAVIADAIRDRECVHYRDDKGGHEVWLCNKDTK